MTNDRVEVNVVQRRVLTVALGDYAARWHEAIGDSHHVVSALGAWLLLALLGPEGDAAEQEALRSALGMEVELAASFARELVQDPHPIVLSAIAAWTVPQARGERLQAWLAGLPARAEHGDIPTTGDADAWASRHTGGLIDTFPLDIDETVVAILASALATRVSWVHPFETCASSELGAVGWAGQVRGVLKSAYRHEVFLARTPRAGDVAVHRALGRFGLGVTSVIAAPQVPVSVVMGAAHDIAAALAGGSPDGRYGLFELPLGDGAAWTLTEHRETLGGSDSNERASAIMPAWSVESEHDLLEHPALGVGVAADILGELLAIPAPGSSARQVVRARYSRYGFEAAAVTGIMRRMSARPNQAVRTLTVRFGRPFAVVANALGEDPGQAWDGLPVFSAWITVPEDIPATEQLEQPHRRAGDQGL